jgi:hypothetical protein
MNHERNTNAEEENSSIPGENKWNIFEKSKLKEKFTLAQGSNAK